MNVLEEIKSLANPEQAKHLQRFFKTGRGQYGEGDLFLGIKVPIVRSVAKKYYGEISLEEINELLNNKLHEVRLLALLLMVLKYEKNHGRTEIFQLYLNNVQNINNWDLVDLSAPRIIGHYVFENNNSEIFYTLANSEHLWSERISVISQYYFLKRGEFSHLLRLSENFLTHNHDLMHKAVGWMLREMGKVYSSPLYDFLDKYHKVMPRTMLRYSIEKLPQEERLHYMQKDSCKS